MTSNNASSNLKNNKKDFGFLYFFDKKCYREHVLNSKSLRFILAQREYDFIFQKHTHATFSILHSSYHATKWFIAFFAQFAIHLKHSKKKVYLTHIHKSFFIKRSFEPFREEQQEDKRYMNDLCKNGRIEIKLFICTPWDFSSNNRT